MENTEQKRIRNMWEDAAKRSARAELPIEHLAECMLAAACNLLQQTMGLAALAQYLGRLAVASHTMADGQVEEVLPGEGDAGDGSSRLH